MTETSRRSDRDGDRKPGETGAVEEMHGLLSFRFMVRLVQAILEI